MCVVSDWMTGDWGGWWVDLFCLRPRHGSNIGANNKKKKDKTFRRIDTLTEFAIWTFRLKIPNRATTKKCCKFYANFMHILCKFYIYSKVEKNVPFFRLSSLLLGAKMKFVALQRRSPLLRFIIIIFISWQLGWASFIRQR